MSFDLEEIITSEEIEAKELEKIVEEAFYDEEVLSKKIQEIEEDTDVTFGQRLSDLVAEFGGSWKFIILICVSLALWVLINTMTSFKFDSFPFIFLNLILSCIAATQAPIIMMSQNRQEAKDRRRSRSDYMLNLKAEMEIQRLHDKVNKITELQKSQIDHVIKIQKLQIEALDKIMKKLEDLK